MLIAPELLIFSAAVSLLCVFIRGWRQRRLRGGLPLPPGPKGLPILGNMLDIDISAPWLSLTDWAKKYGDLFYFTVLGYEIIVINSEELAHALLDRRSGVYSDRPYMSAIELFGMDFATASLSCGDRWRQHRKMYHVALRKEASREYQSLQLQKVHEFLKDVIVSPTQFREHTRMLTTAIIMAVGYGYDVVPVEDQFVNKLDRFVGLFMKVFTFERLALTGAFPILQRIPSWFPGGRYKRGAKESRSFARDVLDDPVNFVKEEMAGGTTRQSFVKELLGRHMDKDNKITVEDEEIVKEIAANLFFSGGETTDAVIHVFLLAMILYPEVQIKAQEEIDRVVGDSRLPDFSDREKLPYIEAVYLETLRWRTTVPITIPHATSTSDVYNGYYIPKGAVVLINTWAMTHNKTHFPDSMSFKPERHLSPGGKLFQAPATLSFGFGRRHCPGKYLADQSVWATVVSTLATLRIGKPKDSIGCEIDVKPEFTSGLGVRPKPFACSIEPRSVNAERLIRNTSEAPALAISTPPHTRILRAT